MKPRSNQKSSQKTDAATIASRIVSAGASGLNLGASLADGAAQPGLALAGLGLQLVASIVQAFGSEAPVVIASIRDVIEAKTAADARVAKLALEKYGLRLEVTK